MYTKVHLSESLTKAKIIKQLLQSVQTGQRGGRQFLRFESP